MINLLKEVEALRKVGKLHTRLIIRTAILLSVSLALGGIVVYNLLFKGVDFFTVFLIVLLGFILGFTIFSRINTVGWDEEKRIVQTGRMDVLGIAVLILYIGFDIYSKNLLQDAYPASSSTFLLAILFGTLFGRAMGTIVDIHKVFVSNYRNHKSLFKKNI